MDYTGKKYKNRISGDIITIMDQYQNVAITSNKEKIDVNILLNDKLFIPVENQSNNLFGSKKTDESVDPAQFFDSTYREIAGKIISVDTSKLPEDNNFDVNIPRTYDNLPVSNSNENIVYNSSPEDEIEELKRKYEASSVDDSVRRQNEIFSKILDPEVNNEPVVKNNIPYQEPTVEVQRFEVERPEEVQRFEVQDPILNMFKGVKRNLDFKINLKIEGKIPRLDFIEMMEDSYEVSIIEFLADEFTNNIIKDPSYIRNIIFNEIKKMVNSNDSNKSESKNESKPKEVKPKTPRKRAVRPTKIEGKTKKVVVEDTKNNSL